MHTYEYIGWGMIGIVVFGFLYVRDLEMLFDIRVFLAVGWAIFLIWKF